MANFIKVEVVVGDKEKKEKYKPVRINLDHVTDYRPWLNEEGKEYTAFFYSKETKKPKVIADISVGDVDGMLRDLNIIK